MLAIKDRYGKNAILRGTDLEERAAQFSPFSALTGYEAAIDKTRRRAQHELEEDPFTRRPYH